MSYNLVNPTTGDLTRVAGGTLYADNPIGSIIPFGSSTIPTGYLLCNGQAVSRTTYSALFAVIGTAFGTGDGSTTFNVPDLREATTKGVGLSGKSNNHYDADGVALGEFVEDRVQNGINALTINNDTGLGFTVGTYYSEPGLGIETMRSGNTTEVKAVGVNYIIKAKHIGIPSDFIDAVDDAIADTTVDTVADGNMSPVTSNAVSKYGIKFDTSASSAIPDIANTFIKFRKAEGIITMDIQDENKTGTSIDFDYKNGNLRFYNLTNGSVSNTWTFSHS